MGKVEDSLTGLYRSTKITAGARFNAARRLEKRDWFATFSIAMFSAISVGIAIVQKIYALRAGSLVDNYLTALSVSVGIFVIVISLIEWGINARRNAEYLLKNAEDLTCFKHKLTLRINLIEDGIALPYEEAKQLEAEYEQIKRSCPVNHEPVDKNLFLIENPSLSEFATEDKIQKINSVHMVQIRLESLLSGIRYFLILWAIILGLLAVAILKY